MKRSRTQSSTQSVGTKYTRRSRSSSNALRRYRSPTYKATFNEVGFPRQLTIRHKYCETVNITTSAGGLGSYVFNCNGMYDPNQTGTGHQPMYFDTCTGIYDHYTVIKSKCKFTFVAKNTASAANVGGYINDDATVSIGSFNAACEASSGKGAVIPSVSNGQQENKVVWLYWDAVKAFGPSPVTDPNLQGTAAANPTETQCFVAVIQATDLASAVACDVMVEIEYTAVWEELKDLTVQ